MLGLVGEFFRQFGIVVASDAVIDIRIELGQGVQNRLDRRVLFEPLRFEPTQVVLFPSRHGEKRADDLGFSRAISQRQLSQLLRQSI